MTGRLAPAWRSNIAPGICIELASNSSIADAFVTDEDGDQYHFIGGNITIGGVTSFQFVPMPSGRHEKSTFLTTLAISGNSNLTSGNISLVLTKKYGTTVIYNSAGQVGPQAQSDLTGSGNETFYFFRAATVTDHLLNTLNYDYGNSTTALIPNSIVAKNAANGTIVGATMNITVYGGSDPWAGKVNTITDGDGKTTTYTYGNFSDSYPKTTAELINVEDAAGGNVTYGYSMVPEVDTTPHDPSYTGPYPIYDHLELANITDQNGNMYQFQHAFTYNYYWTQGFMNYSATFGYYPAAGHPRVVTKVTLPGGSNTTLQGYTLVKPQGGGGVYLPSSDSQRTLNVIDADGRQITYSWTGAQVVPQDVPYALQLQAPNSLPCIVLYTTMCIDYGSSYGKE